jgi:hypothetical protein
MPIKGSAGKIPRGNHDPALRILFYMRVIPLLDESVDFLALLEEKQRRPPPTPTVETQEGVDTTSSAPIHNIHEGVDTIHEGEMEDTTTEHKESEKAEAETVPMRAFRLCVDARALRATMRFPLAIGHLYVKLKLPPELEGNIGLNIRLLCLIPSASCSL